MSFRTTDWPVEPDRTALADGTIKGKAAGLVHGCCGSGEDTGLGETQCRSDLTKNTRSAERNCSVRVQEQGLGLQPLNLERSPKSSLDDVEKGRSVREHIVLSVEGLTCVGCETKLYRSLESFPSISNLQTSLLLSRAEFDVDLSASSVNDIIGTVKKSTGFICERIKSSEEGLDLLVAGDGKRFVDQPLPPGVTDLTLVESGIVRVNYNPRTIGARDLIETGFGVPLSLAPPRPHPALAAGRNDVRRKLYMTLLSALLTMPVLILAWAPLPKNDIAYGAISLVLATIVQCVVAGPFYPTALRSLLFTHVVEMDLLIVLSTTTAYIFSVVSFAYQIIGQPLSTGEFFETSTLLVTLIMLGRLVSAFARHKAIESISITSLQVDTALLVEAGGSGEKEIDARLLQYGDTFKVMPESRVPTDGIIVTGTTEVDESMVTGESELVKKDIGSTVIAGSLNGSGTITVRLTQLPSENTISEIAGMIDEAKFSKPRIQALADRVAGYFVPVVVTLATLTFITWSLVGRLIRHQTASSAVVQAITYAISVIIVSCPCAIGLAVPMVVVIAGGVAAKHGVIFKSAETIEAARNVNHVVFDKTGTLTQGLLSVCTEEYMSQSRDFTMSLALGLTSNINHPVSSAIAAHLKSLDVQATPLAEVKSIPGNGVEGTCNGTTVRAGNCRWLSVQDSQQVQSALSKGLTVFCLTSGPTLLAVYGLSDTLRPEAHTVITSLRSRNIDISIVSGDDHGPVHSIATQLGIPASNVRSRCSPRDKQEYIQALIDTPLPSPKSHSNLNPKSNSKPKPQTVLFVGDGTNDGPALATATIGLHIPSLPRNTSPTTTFTPDKFHNTHSLAQTASSATLTRPSLLPLLALLDLSRAVHRRIVFNFVWAFAYNVFAVMLAAGVFEAVGKRGVRVEPKWAALGEVVSLVPVVLVGVGLRWVRV